MDWLWALAGREIPSVAKGLMRGFVCTVRRHYWQNGTSCRAESVPCNSSASRPGSSQRGWKMKRKTCILPGEPERALPVTPVAWVTPSSLSTFKRWTQRKVRFARLSCECHEQATWPYRHGNCGISHWVIKPFQVLWELKGEGGGQSGLCETLCGPLLCLCQVQPTHLMPWSKTDSCLKTGTFTFFFFVLFSSPHSFILGKLSLNYFQLQHDLKLYALILQISLLKKTWSN